MTPAPRHFPAAFVALQILLAAPSQAFARQDVSLPEIPVAATYPIDVERAPRPTATAVRTSGDIDVDGQLDESAWQEAEVISEFIQQRPQVGYPATERTEVRLLYDDEQLYIGAELFDSDPSGIVIPTLDRDPNTRDGDAFGFVLDTFLDRSSGFAFYINPGGAIRDGQTADDSRSSNFSWEGVYQLRTRVHDEGWTVELSIPWSTLRFGPARREQRWGLNFLRRVRRKHEDSTWAPMDRQRPLHAVSRAGTLVGLEGIRPGRNLSAKPYLSSSRPSGEVVPAEREETDFDAGLDLKWGVTPGLTLDLTYNTDFSQVEVDEEQVNLTRFSLFFPEKREFFLENQGIFGFGDQGSGMQRSGASSRDFTLFHSRRVGLTSSGDPIPILGGGRLSGTAGPLELGVLNMQTRRLDGLEPENFSVARVRVRPATGLDVGGIFTQRQTTRGETARSRSYGVDANYQVGNYLLLQSYLAGTAGTDAERELAGRLSVTWRDPFWHMAAMYRQFGDDFAPDMGFVRRTGIRHSYAMLGVTPRVSWPLVEEVNPYAEVHYFTNLDGLLETRTLSTGLDFSFRDGSEAELVVQDNFERITSAFVLRGATIRPGAYRFRDVQAELSSSRARPLSGSIAVGGGGFYDGDRVSLGGSILWRASHRLLFETTADHNRIDLPGEEPFTADVYGARLQFFLSTRFRTSAYVQYNEATSELVTNLRLNWIHAPVSDLFLVLTERRDSDRSLVLERVLSAKVTRYLAF